MVCGYERAATVKSMTVAEFNEQYPGAAVESYTLTDIAHAIRACSGGNLGDTFWCEIQCALEDIEGVCDEYLAGTIFEAISGLTAEGWLHGNGHRLLSELATSKRAGGITWELVEVGKSGNQLYWRAVEYKQVEKVVERPFMPLLMTTGTMPRIRIP